MKVFSYIVAHDTGFAPNPFHGLCTLACCKPILRRSAKVGDIVVGLSRGSKCIIYAMRVASVHGFAGYWTSPTFTAKRANMMSHMAIENCGDNIYEPTSNGTFRQIPSKHSNWDGSEHAGNKARDLGGLQVLVAKDFTYFGTDALPLPSELRFLTTGRGHRCHFSSDQVRHVGQWFNDQPRGVLGRPAGWPASDASWTAGSGSSGCS